MEESKSFSNYLLIIGGFLMVFVNLPIINQILPIISISGSGSTILGPFTASGGIYFFPSEMKINMTLFGLSTSGSSPVNGWSILGLPGFIFFIIFGFIGGTGFILGLNSFKEFLSIDASKQKQYSIYVGVIGGVSAFIFAILVYLGDCSTQNTYGLSGSCIGTLTSEGITLSTSIGIGFVILIISIILMLISGIIHAQSPLKEDLENTDKISEENH